MILKINGQDQAIDGELKLTDLISSKSLNCERIVVEHNYQIIPRDKWQEVFLKEGDNLEIVSFVGGG